MSVELKPIEHIKRSLYGRWEQALAHFGLGEQIKAAPPNVHTPCPKSGAGKTKFRRFRDVDKNGGCYHNDLGPLSDGIAVISWLNDWNTSKTVKELLNFVGGMPTEFVKSKPLPKDAYSSYELSAEEVEKRKKVLRKVWAGSKPIPGTPAETYLRNRGIKGDLSDLGALRYHSNLLYMDETMEKPLWIPGLLAIYSDGEGKPLTMHRTFLNEDGSGKANVASPKKIISSPGDIRGGAIRLDCPVEDENGDYVIGLCEGLENGLSVREATGCPMWIGYSDRVMTMVKLDPRIKTVIVWADKEPSGAGIRAANDIKEKLEAEGRKVIIEIPNDPRPKVDWNDIYAERGIAGFPWIMRPEMRVSACIAEG